MGGGGGNANRQAIGRGFGYRIGTDVAAGARPVLDDHRPQSVFDPLGQRAGRHVDWAAGGVGHDQADRLGLCQGDGACQSCQQGDGRQQQGVEFHGV